MIEVRNTVKQKALFYEELKEQYKDEIRLAVYGKNNNIVIGDLENCKIVLSAHYDTARETRIHFYRHYMGWSASLLYTFSIVALIFAIFHYIPILYVTTKLFEIITIRMDYVFYGAYLLRYWIVIWLFLPKSKANESNINDNTSGIKQCLNYYNKHRDVAVVLFDNEEKGLKGSKAMKKDLADKFVINLDCVGVGELLVAVRNTEFIPSNIYSFTKNSVSYFSDHRPLKNAITLTVAKKDVLGLYLKNIHSPWDTEEHKHVALYVSRELEKLVREVELWMA